MSKLPKLVTLVSRVEVWYRMNYDMKSKIYLDIWKDKHCKCISTCYAWYLSEDYAEYLMIKYPGVFIIYD